MLKRTRRDFLGMCAATGTLSSAIAKLTPPAPASPQTSSSVVSSLAPHVARHEIAGAVTVVANKERILDLGTIGYADIASHRPMRPDTIFWIASMSKPIASTAFMMLVDDGLLSLDDPIVKHLPEFTPKIVALTADGTGVELQEPHPAITPRHLLSHTSGIQKISTLEDPTYDLHPLSLRVRSYGLSELAFQPGANYMYANPGINTVARLIEVKAGMPYEQFIQERILTPLGMADTTFFPSDEQVARVATSYEPDTSGKNLESLQIELLHYPLTDRKTRFVFPGGGLFSTAADLTKFCRMLLNGGTLDGKRYISEAAIATMRRNEMPEIARKGFPTTPQAGKLVDIRMSGYGLAWYISPDGGFSHGGAYCTNMRIDPVRGLVTIFLVQLSDTNSVSAAALDDFTQAAARRYRSV